MVFRPCPVGHYLLSCEKGFGDFRLCCKFSVCCGLLKRDLGISDMRDFFNPTFSSGTQTTHSAGEPLDFRY